MASALLWVLTGFGIPGDGDQKTPKKKKSAGGTLVKVDISEEVDGRAYTAHSAQYWTVRMLWFAGLDFKSERKTRWDKKLEAYKPRKTENPDFLVQGESTARVVDRVTWYDGVVGYVYLGESEITIQDSGGKGVARYRLSLKRSDKTREAAILKTLNRLGRYSALAVVECEKIRKRVPEKREEELKKTLETIRKEVAQFGGSLEELPVKETEETGETGETGKDGKESPKKKGGAESETEDEGRQVPKEGGER